MDWIFSTSGWANACFSAIFGAALGYVNLFNTRVPRIGFASFKHDNETVYVYSHSDHRLCARIVRLLGRAPKDGEVEYGNFSDIAGLLILLSKHPCADSFLQTDVGIDGESVMKMKAFAKDPLRVAHENWEKNGLLKNRARSPDLHAPTDIENR